MECNACRLVKFDVVVPPKYQVQCSVSLDVSMKTRVEEQAGCKHTSSHSFTLPPFGGHSWHLAGQRFVPAFCRLPSNKARDVCVKPLPCSLQCCCICSTLPASYTCCACTHTRKHKHTHTHTQTHTQTLTHMHTLWKRLLRLSASALAYYVLISTHCASLPSPFSSNVHTNTYYKLVLSTFICKGIGVPCGS